MPSKTIVAIISITILLSLAIWQHIDGALLGAGIAAIAGLGGWAAHKASAAKKKD